MKLNNRGWGIREMLFLSGILIFFFCLAVYLIYIFYGSFSQDLSIVNYKEMVNYKEVG